MNQYISEIVFKKGPGTNSQAQKYCQIAPIENIHLMPKASLITHILS